MAAIDFNPVVVAALQVSPWLAVPAACSWILLITGAMIVLRPSLRRKAFLLLCVSHLVCVWGWIVRWDVTYAMAFVPVALIVVWVTAWQIATDRQVTRA